METADKLIDSLGESEEPASELLHDEGFDPEQDSVLPEDSAEKAPEDEQRPEEKKPEEPSEADLLKKQLEELQAQNEKLDKRYKDTQASYTKGQQQIAELQKKLESKEDSYFAEEEISSGEETPQLESLRKEIEDMRADLARQRWEVAAAPVKAAHDDFGEVVEELLATALETDAALAERYAEMGKTPENAYKLGKELKEKQEILRDPEAYREKLKQQLMEELKSTEEPSEKKKPAPELPDTDMGTDNSAKGAAPPEGSVLDELF